MSSTGQRYHPRLLDSTAMRTHKRSGQRFRDTRLTAPVTRPVRGIPPFLSIFGKRGRGRMTIAVVNPILTAPSIIRPVSSRRGRSAHTTAKVVDHNSVKVVGPDGAIVLAFGDAPRGTLCRSSSRLRGPAPMTISLALACASGARASQRAFVQRTSALSSPPALLEHRSSKRASGTTTHRPSGERPRIRPASPVSSNDVLRHRAARASSRRARSRGTRSEEGGRPRERSPRLRTRPGGWGRPALTEDYSGNTLGSQGIALQLSCGLHPPARNGVGVLADLGITVGFVTDIVEIRRWRCILSRARPLMAMRSSR